MQAAKKKVIQVVKLIRAFRQNNDYTAEFSAIGRRAGLQSVMKMGRPGWAGNRDASPRTDISFFILVLTRYVRDI
jgi:hypothetical protein